MDLKDLISELSQENVQKFRLTQITVTGFLLINHLITTCLFKHNFEQASYF